MSGWSVFALAVLSAVLGAALGYFACFRRQQQLGGGKTAAQLRAELDERERATAAHFERSAVLLHELGTQYAELYRHLADGAERLTTPTLASQRIGFKELDRLSVTRDASAAPSAPVVASMPLGLRPEAERNGEGSF